MRLHVTTLTLWLAVGALRAQPPSPQFEVASIKPHPVQGNVFRIPGAGSNQLRTNGNRFTEQFANLRTLMMDAYDVEDFQIQGLPDWAVSGSDLYDVEATVSEGASPSSDQLRAMLQALLADRFGLKLHRETKDIPVFDLVISRSGSRLKPVAPEAGKSRGIGIAALIVLISQHADRPVINRTGLDGGFEFIPLDSEGLLRAKKADSTGPTASIFTEVREKWGLRLEARKGPMEILVVDHAERPSEN